MQVRVLGPIEIVGSSGDFISVPGVKLRGLVAILALDAGRTIAPQRIIDALWGEQMVNGLNTVQGVVSKLRRALTDAGETDRILTRPSGYQLDVARDDVDALRFEAMLGQAREVADSPAAATDALGGALALWSGEPLAGAPDTELTSALRARLYELHRVAVEDLVDAELALGRHQRLASELEALVAEEPLRERRWGQLIRALYGSGRQAEALRAFQRARQSLIEVGVEPSAELRRLEAAVLAQDPTLLVEPSPPDSPAPVAGSFRRRGNVRHPIGSCIGREDDIDRLVDLVGRHRLVTLTGPGGVGKTRLALELAIALMDDVPDGVWWVDLAAARNDTDALAAVQRALRLDAIGFSDPQKALAGVTEILGDDAAVLVLDNCEQLLGSLAPIVEELLGFCRQARIVATSREGLGIPGELLFNVVPLAPLAAVALFEERIEGMGIDHDDAADAIAQICERLDRLPLALELAAARARHLRLTEILERLADRFELLQDGTRSAWSRPRDLRAVADWSYELLDEPERIVFERLSVFADGATLEAARSVCAGRGVASADVEQLLDRLIDKSLIFADRSGAETRFRMLQTLADYAGDRLTARGDRDAALRAHATWVLDLARTVQFGAPTTGATVAAVQDEDVAVRDAIGWSLATEPLLALEICTMLAPFWFGTMRVSVGWELLALALDAAGEEDRDLRSSALVWAVLFSSMVHDVEAAARLADEAYSYEQSVGDPARLGRICLARALAAGYLGDQGAADWVGRARKFFAVTDSAVALGHVNFAEGAVRLVEGDLDGAMTRLGDAIDVFREGRDHLGLILAVSRLGELAWRRGDLELFAEMHASLLELGREGRSAGVTTGATARLALARLEQGSIDEAHALARAALESSGESFMPVVNGYAFKTAGLVDLRLGHVAEGRSELHAAIDAFGRGAGNVGVGQAAMCWIDLSRSQCETGELEGARRSAESAVEAAVAAGDPWIQGEARAQLALVAPVVALPS